MAGALNPTGCGAMTGARAGLTGRGPESRLVFAFRRISRHGHTPRDETRRYSMNVSVPSARGIDVTPDGSGAACTAEAGAGSAPAGAQHRQSAGTPAADRAGDRAGEHSLSLRLRGDGEDRRGGRAAAIA